MNQREKIIPLAIVAVIAMAMATVLLWPKKETAPDFGQYEAGLERKQAFFDYFVPLVRETNRLISLNRERLLEWRDNRDDIGWWDTRRLRELAELYRVEDFAIDDDASWARLLRRADVIPVSLVLAQAANESGWGTSRFARLGNNYFGQWCFEPGCGLVPRDRGAGKKHEVAVFESPRASVEAYIRNLNSHPAYQGLRGIRQQLRSNDQPVTGIALAAGLEKYSERGAEYIEELRAMIRFNDLARYDMPLAIN